MKRLSIGLVFLLVGLLALKAGARKVDVHHHATNDRYRYTEAITIDAEKVDREHAKREPAQSLDLLTLQIFDPYPEPVDLPGQGVVPYPSP